VRRIWLGFAGLPLMPIWRTCVILLLVALTWQLTLIRRELLTVRKGIPDTSEMEERLQKVVDGLEELHTDLGDVESGLDDIDNDVIKWGR